MFRTQCLEEIRLVWNSLGCIPVNHMIPGRVCAEVRANTNTHNKDFHLSSRCDSHSLSFCGKKDGFKTFSDIMHQPLSWCWVSCPLTFSSSHPPTTMTRTVGEIAPTAQREFSWCHNSLKKWYSSLCKLIALYFRCMIQAVKMCSFFSSL